MDKYVEKKEDRHLFNVISHIKKNENEIVEEFNNRFNDLVKSMPQDVKPPENFLLSSYLDAFGVDASYELRKRILEI